MSVTLADISRQAGVSITTVSKVLAGKAAPFRISKKTQENVWRVARELNYTPDLHARSLRAGRSNQIGIIVAHFNDLWYGQVIHAIEAVLDSRGYGFLINSVEEDPSKLSDQVSRMRANRAEGLIIVGSRLALTDDIAILLKKAKLPVMLVNRRSAWPWVSSIVFDHVHTCRIATEHLLGLGHRHIGLLLGPQWDPGNEARITGYRRALEAVRLETDADDFEYAEPQGGLDSCRNGYEAVKNLLRRRPRLTGVIAFDDSVAMGALRGAAEIGIHVPRELSVIGVDDAPHAEFMSPPLTTVRLPTAEVGQAAAERVLDLLASPRRRTSRAEVEVQGSLVVRQSTARAPGG